MVSGFKAYGDDLEVVRPCEGVVVLKGGCWSETMTVIDTGKTLVVVDTYASYKLAEKARVYIDKIFNKPVSHVINTHHHWDHTFGNQVFKNSVIIGHKFCLEDMKKLIHSLEDILSYKKPVKFIMPGHGSPLPNPELTIPAAYFKRLWKVVKEAKKQGKSMAEAEEMFKNDTELAKRAEKFLSKHQSNLSILWRAQGTGTY
jgi:glyoxylase-like metal-dependent hydrolase (beta-lactamase superfamily II)